MISNKHMYVQFIDDERGMTLASASTRGMEGKNNAARAGKLGQAVLEKARAAGVRQVVVDRGGHRFHGRLRAIVEPLKQAGLLTGSKEEP
jgi:large subunit ribosomal protein L18